MDKPIWDYDFQYQGPQSVRVSCHAGDQGSKALSNIIGDQPLFYIDDSADEDEFLFVEEDQAMPTALLPSDEKFLAKMRQKIESYDRAAKSLSQFDIVTPEDNFDQLLNNDNEDLSLDDIINYGQQSSIFKSYYDFIIDKNIDIKLSKQIKTSHYIATKKTIQINPSLNITDASVAFIKSMRLAWHDHNGVLLNPLSFLPEEAVLINRLIEADSDIAEVALLWDLNLAGHHDVWARAMCGANYDLCSAYAMEAMADFRSIKSGLAMRSTFEKWFISGRCKQIDRNIIQIMMGGHTDLEINDRDASRVIAMDIIAGLGRVPQADNYLSQIVVQIMNDALYGEVRDRSNANFLWFVSFERRMSDMEQELQSDEKSEIETQNNHDNVITLPQGHTQNGTYELNTSEHASLFFLDHFRGL